MSPPITPSEIDLTIVDNSLVYILSFEVDDTSFNRYVYLQGCANTVAGTPVTYKEDGTTTVLTAGAVGPVAIAMAAINSTSKYGWYQIKGTYASLISDTVAAYKSLYISSTPGRVSETVATGDLVLNAWSTADNIAGTPPTVAVRIDRPWVTGKLG